MSSMVLPSPKEYPAVCLKVGGHYVLGFGDDSAFLGQPVFGAPVFVRHAFRFVLADEYVFPHTVVDDRGTGITGEEAVPWIMRRGYAFPRADVLGVTESGTPRACFMKELDLEIQRTYAARSSGEFPGVRVDLAVTLIDCGDEWAIAPDDRYLPELAQAIPTYRFHPSLLGSLSAMLLQNVLAAGHRDLRITLDDLDDYVADREE